MNTQLKWKLLAAAVVVGLGLSKAQAGTTADASITVTPVAAADISISPASYAFGNLDGNTSSISASAPRSHTSSLMESDQRKSC